MPPKRKKPGATIPKGCEVVSVSEVEAGVNSHVYNSGSGKSGSNLTEKDKVDFLCLLRQMSVSSDDIGNHTNSGLQSSPKASAGHSVTLANTDISSWTQQPPTATNATSGNSPEWEYLNFQELLKSNQKDQPVRAQSASPSFSHQDIKSCWADGLQAKAGENAILRGPDQLIQQAFPKPPDIAWPAPPGLQQTKFVRQPMVQPQLPMPNFPQAQHPQLPISQGMLPSAQSPFTNISLPQHALINLPQHPQFTQPQQIPISLPPQPGTPENTIMSCPPGIRPNSNQNPLVQSGLFLTHPGMAQPWPSSAMVAGQVQQNQAQHTLAVTSKQPFLPVRPVVSSRSVAVNQQDIQFHIQRMQQPFSPQKQVEQPRSVKEQVPTDQQVPNPQIRPPPGLLNQNHPAKHAPLDSKLKQENVGSNQLPQQHELPQALQPVKTSAQTQEEIDKLLGNLTLTTGQHPNAQVVHQANKATKSPGQKNGRNNQQMRINGAEPQSCAETPMMEILKAALNYIDFRGGRPQCIPCQRWLHQDELMNHLKNPNHLEMMEVYDIKVTCYELPSKKEFYLVLTLFLEEEYQKLRITNAQMAEVNNVVVRLNDLLKSCLSSKPEELQKKLQTSSIRLYGSLATGMALKENIKLNLDLNLHNVPKELTLVLFLEFVKLLEENESFSDVKHVMADSYSGVTFTDVKTGLPVALSLNNHNSYKLSQLIKTYGELDERVLKLCVLFRAWGKMCKVDNPDESALLPHAFPLLVIFFMQKQRLIPVLHELVDNSQKSDPYRYLDAEAASKIWKSKATPLGELWVHLFFFYLYEHDVSKHVVCITQSYPFRRGDTNWRARRIAIIDPFQPKRNVACHTSQVMSRFIDNCFLYTFLHYAIPQTEHGPAFGCIRKNSQWFCQDFRSHFIGLQEINDIILQMVLTTNSYHSGRPDGESLRTHLRKQLAQKPMFKYLLSLQRQGELRLFPAIVCDDKGIAGKEMELFADWSVTVREAHEIFKQFRVDKLRFRFDKGVFTKDTEAPIWCRACSKVGHKRPDCPDEIMPVPEDLPLLSQKDIDVLNTLCDSVCDKWSASIREITDRDDMKNELLQFIREKFPDANLDIFGSSNNGFGSRQSDVDLCLTFADKPDGDGIDFASMINRIGDMLRKHKNVTEVNPVSMAKVPIVKFLWKKNIQVDLSLYNRLGQENTKLLKAYSDIDPRVRPLVYMMKRFVKTACIGDASRGSLSSYAYTLMVLYFLQQVQPPILPVLQELCESGETPPTKEVENANVYFYNDIPNLEKVWPHEKNEKTVGELWLDILDFYVSPRFHQSNKVVSIRKLDPLYKVNKMWMSANLCIEDPFDLAHNLGSGLSRRMSVHIVRCFQRARRHFGSPFPADCPSVEDYFFDADKLMAGKPPCDRGCRVCGHIGHIRDECPERHGNEEQQRQRKRQTSGAEKGNQKQQGRKTQNNGRSTPSSNKSSEQSAERRPKSGERSPSPNASNTLPPACEERPPNRDRPSGGTVPQEADGGPKSKSPARNSVSDKTRKATLPRKTSTRKDPKMSPDGSEAATTNQEELKAKAGIPKNTPLKKVPGNDKDDDGIPLPPKVNKEKTRTFRNSQRKSIAESAGPKVLLPEDKTELKTTPKTTPKATPKTTPKATPKTTPKATPKTTPKATPKTTPKATPKTTPKATPKATAKAGAKDSGSVNTAPSEARKRAPRKRKSQKAEGGVSDALKVPVTVGLSFSAATD